MVGGGANDRASVRLTTVKDIAAMLPVFSWLAWRIQMLIVEYMTRERKMSS